MDIVHKVCVTVADGAIGEEGKGSAPLVVSLRDRKFVDLLSGASLSLVSGPRGFGSSMGMVDVVADRARSNILLDLGDPATRNMLKSWQRHGAKVEFRCGPAVRTIHRPVQHEHHGDIEAALRLPARPQPALFLLLAASPQFQASLGATPLPGQVLPVPSFLVSAALSGEHDKAGDTLDALHSA